MLHGRLVAVCTGKVAGVRTIKPAVAGARILEILYALFAFSLIR
jgi:hypothetical protein